MTPSALVEYLHGHIPLSRAMNVTALRASTEDVLLEAPLAPNINVHGTMFGGSAATLGLLAAWSVLHLRLEAEGIECQLVIYRTEMEYLRPITGTAQALARLDGADWANFVHMLERRGKARLNVAAELTYEGQIAAKLVGEFVAIVER